MKPIDYRNELFKDLQSRLQGDRLLVLAAFRQHGPGTTRQISQKSGIDILTLRPRTTELLELGFVVLVERTAGTHEGEYRACTDGEAWELFRQRQAESLDAQLPLRI